MLRKNLIYRWRILCYLAIVENLVLRFAWSLHLLRSLHLTAQNNLFYTLLAWLEILCRFVWNFFRVEYEQVKISLSSSARMKIKKHYYKIILLTNIVLYFCVLMFCSLNNNYYVITDVSTLVPALVDIGICPNFALAGRI